MHPVTDDEEGILVPFTSLADALFFARDISRRRIGLAVGILGGHYLSTFISPTEPLAVKTRDIFSRILEMTHVVSVIGDKYARNSIKQMVPCVIESKTLRMLMLGLPRLAGSGWANVINDLIASFADIAKTHTIDHDLGFITPIDFGKRAILEYDYYIDHTDSAESEKIQQAMQEIEPMVDKMSAANKGIKFLKYIFSQGCARKEDFLYT